MKRIPSVLAIVLLVSTQIFCGLPGNLKTPEIPPDPAEASYTPDTCPNDLTSTSLTPEPEIVGTIDLVISQVETGRANNLQPLNGKQDFLNGDSVRVTQGGKGNLLFKNKIQVTLFNETEVSGVSVTIDPPETKMKLNNQGFSGEVDPGCTFIVDLPNGARITILGTTFFVVYDPVTQMAIAGNFDGSVRYTPPNGAEQVLTPGQMVNIPSQGDVVLMPLPFTPEQLESAVDGAGTPTAGLSILQAEYHIEPLAGAPSAPRSGVEVLRLNHDEGVFSVAFSPDGKLVASGGLDGTTRIWDSVTGSEIIRKSHTGPVGHVFFSPNGKYLISQVYETFSVWDVVTGNDVFIENSDLRSVDFSADGNYIVTVDSDLVHVSETTTGKELIAKSANGGVRSVAISPDGRLVASVGPFVVSVWDIQTGDEIASMELQQPPVEGASLQTCQFCPDIIDFSLGGNYLIGLDLLNGNIRVWEVITGRAIQLASDAYLEFDLSSDGKFIVLASASSYTIRISELSNGKEVANMQHYDDGTLDYGVCCVNFSSDGKYVVSGGYNTVRIWEANTGIEVSRMVHNSELTSVAFSPDGKYVVSAGGNTVIVWMW